MSIQILPKDLSVKPNADIHIQWIDLAQHTLSVGGSEKLAKSPSTDKSSPYSPSMLRHNITFDSSPVQLLESSAQRNNDVESSEDQIEAMMSSHQMVDMNTPNLNPVSSANVKHPVIPTLPATYDHGNNNSNNRNSHFNPNDSVSVESSVIATTTHKEHLSPLDLPLHAPSITTPSRDKGSGRKSKSPPSVYSSEKVHYELFDDTEHIENSRRIHHADPIGFDTEGHHATHSHSFDMKRSDMSHLTTAEMSSLFPAQDARRQHSQFTPIPTTAASKSTERSSSATHSSKALLLEPRAAKSVQEVQSVTSNNRTTTRDDVWKQDPYPSASSVGTGAAAAGDFSLSKLKSNATSYVGMGNTTGPKKKVVNYTPVADVAGIDDRVLNLERILRYSGGSAALLYGGALVSIVYKIAFHALCKLFNYMLLIIPP